MIVDYKGAIKRLGGERFLTPDDIDRFTGQLRRLRDGLITGRWYSREDLEAIASKHRRAHEATRRFRELKRYGIRTETMRKGQNFYYRILSK